MYRKVKAFFTGRSPRVLLIFNDYQGIRSSNVLRKARDDVINATSLSKRLSVKSNSGRRIVVSR